MAAINNAVHSVQLPQDVETVTNGGNRCKRCLGKRHFFRTREEVSMSLDKKQ